MLSRAFSDFITMCRKIDINDLTLASIGAAFGNLILLTVVLAAELFVLALTLDLGGFWGVMAYITLRVAYRLISSIRESKKSQLINLDMQFDFSRVHRRNVHDVHDINAKY